MLITLEQSLINEDCNQAVEIDMMVTWLSPLDLETPAGAGVQVGKEEAKQLADAGRKEFKVMNGHESSGKFRNEQ